MLIYATFENVYIYLLIGIALILILVTVFIPLFFKKKTKKLVVATQDLENIFNALGHENVKAISKVTDRLKITLKDKNLIDSKALQSFGISASINGQDLTILYREDSEALYQFIKEKIK